MKALFVFTIQPYFLEGFALAVAAMQRGWETEVLIGWRGPDADAAERACRDNGIPAHRIPAPYSYGEAEKKRTSGTRDSTAGRANHSISPAAAQPDAPSLAREIKRGLVLAHNIASYCGYMIRTRRYADRMLRDLAPDCVLMGPFQSVGKIDNFIFGAAQQRNIPVYGYPVFPHLGQKTSMHSRANNIDAGMLSSRLHVSHDVFTGLLAKFAPSWHRVIQGTDIFYTEPDVMVAAWLTGGLEKNVWQKPVEGFTRTFVPYESSRALLIESEYPAEKIAVSSFPALDSALDNLGRPEFVAELYKHLKLEVSTAFVLCNVEPSAEHHYSSWESHWERFEHLMRVLKATGKPVVLSLHPLCDYENYKYVEEKYGFAISTKYRIYELYPHCAAVTTHLCSTNSLGELFNKPVFLYDFTGIVYRREATGSQIFYGPTIKFIETIDGIGEEILRCWPNEERPASFDALESLPRACDFIIDTIAQDHQASHGRRPQLQAA